ncbi:MAG: sulfatase [Acidobacteriia bacterium]|nr:sulfatase [Terriglobia bacterium]
MKSSIAALWVIAVWFGIVTGLLEGAGLLLFQQINWARWGPMMHVSEEIVWISPLVDLCFFLLLSIPVALLAKVAPRVPAVRVLVFLLTFLCVYDWLTLTNRLFHRACLLLALGVAFAFSRWLGQHQDSALRFWKRTLPWAVAALLVALVGIQGGEWLRERNAVAGLPAPAPGSPNVLVIVVDTLRADHVSSYGYNRPTTPNLDHLAQQGVLFENAISPSSWSLPSHVSLVTGRYVYEHGVGNVQPSPWGGWGSAGLGGFPTLGEALQQKGYRSGAFSANRTYFSHDLGFGRGFVHFEDYFHSPADMFVRTLYGREFSRIYLIRSDKSLVKRMLRALGWTSLLEQDAEGSGSYGGAFGIRKRADAINEEVLRWVDRDRQRPFFAFLNYFDVHDPYGAPRSYPKPAWQQQTLVDQYDDGLKYDDDFIGRLLQALQQRGLAQNTLVIVTSDHGESLGQHNLETHGRALYWELVRVPLMIWYPGHVPAGLRVSHPVTNAAIPETVMDLLGTSGGFPGPALSVLWRTPGAETNWPDPLSELVQNRYPGKKDQAADALEPTASSGAMRSLITPQWQLIVHEKSGIQLYDWKQDTGELNDLVNTPEGKTAALSLSKQLEQMRRAPRQ